ncbi:unnamed protein product [Closterium sp. Naga37s-1]|nr:unnamed protein product [Closterium sp. Naga37s-1]
MALEARASSAATSEAPRPSSPHFPPPPVSPQLFPHQSPFTHLSPTYLPHPSHFTLFPPPITPNPPVSLHPSSPHLSPPPVIFSPPHLSSPTVFLPPIPPNPTHPSSPISPACTHQALAGLVTVLGGVRDNPRGVGECMSQQRYVQFTHATVAARPWVHAVIYLLLLNHTDRAEYERQMRCGVVDFMERPRPPAEWYMPMRYWFSDTALLATTPCKDMRTNPSFGPQLGGMVERAESWLTTPYVLDNGNAGIAAFRACLPLAWVCWVGQWGQQHVWVVLR